MAGEGGGEEPVRAAAVRGEVVVRRILVGLDGSRPSLGALEVAVELAALLEAELEGLFVEEEAWHRVTALGSTGVIGGYTGAVRSLGAGELSRELRAAARRLSRRLGRASRRLAREASFRVERGRAEAVLLAAAAEADLITVGCVGLSPGRAGRLGRTARALAERTETPILFLTGGETARLGRRVVAIGNGGSGAGSSEEGSGEGEWGPEAEGERGAEAEGAALALALAGELARRREVDLEVVAVDAPGSGEDEAGRAAEGSELHLVPELTADAVDRVIGPTRDVVLVVSRHSALLRAHSLEALIRDLRVPVLLV